MLRYFISGRGATHSADRCATLRALPCLLFVVVWVVVVSCISSAQAVTLKTGDIVITAAMNAFGSDNSALLRVDPATGDRTIISDATHGAGPMFQVDSNGTFPSGISRIADGRFLVAAQNGIFYINPATGDRTQLSATPATSAVAVGNQIFAVDRFQLVRIDSTTGVSTSLANFQSGISLLPWKGDLMVAGIEFLASYHLDGTLVRQYLAPQALSMASYAGNDFILGTLDHAEIATHLNTSAPISRVFGPYSSAVLGIGAGADGMIWEAVTAGVRQPSNAIIGFDPNWGGAPIDNPITILSDATHGSGPTFFAPTGLYVVPEPSSIVLAALGLIASVGTRACMNSIARARSRAWATALMTALIVVSVLSVQPSAQAVTLKSGDIVITADMSGQFSAADSALLRVDPLTGNRSVISDATHGAGPMFQVGSSSGTVVPSGISRADDGRFLVAAQNGIFYVDPASGDRSQVSTTPATSAVAVGNQIFAVDRPQLMRIDPATGTSVFLARLSNGFSLIPWDGNLMVAGIEELAQYHLDGTLVENYLSGFWSTSMAAYGEDKLLLGGINAALLRDFKSNSFPFGMGIGRTTAPEVGIGVGADGTVWLAVTNGFGFAPYNAIVGFDPNENNAPLKILSDTTHGSGPAFYAPTGLYVVPEPSSLVLAAIGLIALVGFYAHCR